MEFRLSIGLNGTKETIVSEQNTAKTYGSGALEVFATPAMIGLMEGAAMNAVQSHLPVGYGTVGTWVDVKHAAATPMGMKVTAKAELIEVNGKRLLFQVEARDDVGLIGEGKHERYIVEEEKFLAKTNSKRER
ncbi:thioesterase family protein [Tepidibacillus fermentans]|uniref:Thioesterase superfamily protein n=1 Tax=Tepidibacillus fermentans TaxID=1281767 RepID=A0A4V2USR5_9BACI|nr:thioesterase family protein [Tepidibacillus fermentans]TCS82482.1 thioesterase superfamily protein [Tepidibacillus fermentans]